MKTENLVKACHSFGFFASELREAHTDAVNSDKQFAEVLLYDLIGMSEIIHRQLGRIVDAAMLEQKVADERKSK